LRAAYEDNLPHFARNLETTTMLEIFSRKVVAIIAVGFLASLTGCASTSTHSDAADSVQAAESTFTNFQNDPEMKWMRDHLKDAKAVLISPSIVKAGLIFGGSGGSGVLLTRNSDGQGWSGPAFYHLGTASVGFQAGVEKSEVVTLVMSDKALNSLMSTSFKVGGDVSVAAGPVGMGASAPVTTDMIVFARSKGLYGGVNLDGTVITIDEKGNQAYYGKPVTPVDILVKHNISSPNSASLQRAVGASARK